MREVMQGSAVALILKMTGAGLAFLFHALLARELGADQTGTYFLALTVIMIATIVGRLGLDNPLVRFTAANAAVGDWGTVKGVYRSGIRLALASSLAATLLVYAMAPWLAASVFSKPELLRPLQWMALAVIPLVMLMLHAQVLKGIKRILLASLVEWHGAWISLFAILGLYLLAPRWGVEGAVVGYALGALLTAAIGVWYWQRSTRAAYGERKTFAYGTLLQSSMPLFWVASINYLMVWTSTFMLGMWADSSDVAIYTAASRTALLASAVLFAVNSIAAPKFAELYRRGDDHALLARVAGNSTRLMLAASAPAFAVLLLFPGWIMGWFGPQFVQGAQVLVILTVGELVNVATGSVGHLLMMSGNERLVRNNNAMAALLNVVLNSALIPVAGVTGAAIATSLSVAVKNIAAVYLVAKHLGIQTIPFFGRPR